MLGSITFLVEFQLQPFAFIAKPARDSNLEPLNKYLLKSGMSVGIMFAVIGSSIESFFKFGMVNMKVIRNKKHI